MKSNGSQKNQVQTLSIINSKELASLTPQLHKTKTPDALKLKKGNNLSPQMNNQVSLSKNLGRLLFAKQAK